MLRSAKDISQSANDQGGEPGKRRRSSATPDRDAGAALRSIYQRAVDEDIPDEMLSLLNKLD